jgi:hypothetical protein
MMPDAEVFTDSVFLKDWTKISYINAGDTRFTNQLVGNTLLVIPWISVRDINGDFLER